MNNKRRNVFFRRPQSGPPIPDVALVGDIIGGSLRYNSGTYCHLTDKIYFAPWRANHILEFDYNTFTWTTIGLPAGVPTDARFSGLVHTGSIIIAVPLRTNQAMWFDPVAKTTGLFGNSYAGNFKWYGGALANDGFVYCTPWWSANQVLKIDPVNFTSQLIGPALNLSTQRLSGMCLFQETKVMMANRNYPDPVVYNTDTETIELVDDLSGATTNKFWSCQTLPTNEVFIGKSNFSVNLKVDKTTLNAEYIGTPVGGRAKYYGCGLAPNGLIYQTPASRNDIEVININTGTVDNILTPNTGSEKYLGGPVLAPDGAFYFPPCQANQILRVANIGTPTASMFQFPATLNNFHLTDWNIYQNRY